MRDFADDLPVITARVVDGFVGAKRSTMVSRPRRGIDRASLRDRALMRRSFSRIDVVERLYPACKPCHTMWLLHGDDVAPRGAVLRVWEQRSRGGAVGTLTQRNGVFVLVLLEHHVR